MSQLTMPLHIPFANDEEQKTWWMYEIFYVSECYFIIMFIIISYSNIFR